MKQIHGKIFVWTFKGEIFIRKNQQGAPRKKIDCEQDLDNIRNGSISLDRIVRTSPSAQLGNTAQREIAPNVNSATDFPQILTTTAS